MSKTKKRRLKMKKLVGLFTILTLAYVVLSASPASAGYPYSWFNKYINVCGTYRKAPTTVTALIGTDSIDDSASN